MKNLKQRVVSAVLALALAISCNGVSAFAADLTSDVITPAASGRNANLSGTTTTSWRRLGGTIGVLLASGTPKATINVASACTAYVRIVNGNTGSTVGTCSMNITTVNTNVTFTLSPRTLGSGVYYVDVMFSKSNIPYSMVAFVE